MKISYVLTGYVGSKAPHHDKIKALFDSKCTEYVEPFAGGAAVYFSMPNKQYEHEWLNDHNPNIAIMYYALSNVDLREETANRILALEKPDDKETAKVQFDKARKNLLDTSCCNVIETGHLGKEDIIKIAVSTYLVYSQSFNKSGEGYSSFNGNMRYRWSTYIRIRNSVDRLKTLEKVTNEDSIAIIREKRGDKNVQLYLDPPYIGVCRANKGKNYAVDMIDLISHYELADCIKDAKAAVVLSGYRAPQDGVPTIYDAVLGDEWHCYSLGDVKNYAVKSDMGEKKPIVTEYVWTNRIPNRAKYWVSIHDYKEKLTMEDFFSRVQDSMVDEKMEKRITNLRDIRDYKKFEEFYYSEKGGLKK